MGDRAALATAGYGKYDYGLDRTSGVPPACPAPVLRSAKQDAHLSTVTKVAQRVDEYSSLSNELLFLFDYFQKNGAARED